MLSVKLCRASRSPIASSSLTSFSLRLATVGPSLALLTSRSSNRPLMSSSLSAPTAEPSMSGRPVEGLVEVLVVARPRSRTLANSSRREDVEALLGDRLLAAELGVRVAEARRSRSPGARLALLLVEVGGEVLRDEAVEQHAEDVGLEVPAVDAAAQVVGDAPDGLVQLGAFGFLGVVHSAWFRLNLSEA